MAKKEKSTQKKINEKKSNHSEAFKNAIKEYLDNFAKENELFATKYANPKKNINDCCSFIVSEVQKMGVMGLDDGEVFYLARHYYEEENLEFNSNVSCNVVVNKKVELTEEEKNKAREAALNEYKKQIIKEEQEKAEKEAKKQQKLLEKQKAKEEAKKQDSKPYEQMDLFDMFGGI